MIYLVKGQFQKSVRWMAGSWMSPNMATLAGVFFIGASAATLYLGLARPDLRWLLLLTPLCLVLRMAMNALDGLLSREKGLATVPGEIWNEALDVVGDNVCYGVLIFVPDGPRLTVVALLLAIWAAEFFGVLGKGMPGGVRRHEAAMGGKPDRAFWMGLLAVVLYAFPGFFAYLPYYLGGVTCLVVLTALLRIRMTVRAAEGKPYESYTVRGR
jgi:CDP-diacylglycerol--glycerol-3-phosphate 3-phosphatidyltransferase